MLEKDLARILGSDDRVSPDTTMSLSHSLFIAAVSHFQGA